MDPVLDSCRRFRTLQVKCQPPELSAVTIWEASQYIGELEFDRRIPLKPRPFTVSRHGSYDTDGSPCRMLPNVNTGLFLTSEARLTSVALRVAYSAMLVMLLTQSWVFQTIYQSDPVRPPFLAPTQARRRLGSLSKCPHRDLLLPVGQRLRIAGFVRSCAS